MRQEPPVTAPGHTALGATSEPLPPGEDNSPKVPLYCPVVACHAVVGIVAIELESQASPLHLNWQMAMAAAPLAYGTTARLKRFLAVFWRTAQLPRRLRPQ